MVSLGWGWGGAATSPFRAPWALRLWTPPVLVSALPACFSHLPSSSSQTLPLQGWRQPDCQGTHHYLRLLVFFLFSSPTSKRVFSETPSLPQNLRCLVAALRGRGGPQFLVDPSGNRLQVLQDSVGNEGMRRLTQGQTGLQILPLLCNRGRDTSC